MRASRRCGNGSAAPCRWSPRSSSRWRWRWRGPAGRERRRRTRRRRPAARSCSIRRCRWRRRRARRDALGARGRGGARLFAASSGAELALATTADGLVEGPTTDLALIESALDRLTPGGGDAAPPGRGSPARARSLHHRWRRGATDRSAGHGALGLRAADERRHHGLEVRPSLTPGTPATPTSRSATSQRRRRRCGCASRAASRGARP